MDDLEQLCEDAVFEVCDARERYPLQCALELEKCIQLQNDIHTVKVSLKPTSNDTLNIMEEKQAGLNIDTQKENICFKDLDYKLEKITSKINNLKAVMEQIHREKTCSMNVLLKN